MQYGRCCKKDERRAQTRRKVGIAAAGLDPDKKFKIPNGQNARAVLAYSSLGIQVAVIVGGFAYLGKWLDEKYPMDKRWFTLALVLFGVAASIYYVIRQLNEINDRNEK